MNSASVPPTVGCVVALTAIADDTPCGDPNWHAYAGAAIAAQDALIAAPAEDDEVLAWKLRFLADAVEFNRPCPVMGAIAEPLLRDLQRYLNACREGAQWNVN